MDTIGRYQVVRLLGSGGMGQVFLARDPTLERDVALKLLRRDATQSTLRDEAKSLAALNHPGIVTVYEIGEHDGQDFITMEYLAGRSLRQLLQDGIDRRQILAIGAKVASAVAAAHRAGILHRDIKPENIVVGAAGEVKVVDFGIARRLEHAATRPMRAITASEVVEILRKTLPPDNGTDTIVSAGTQTMFGTPAYMAPEVLLGDGSTEASDIYSLGIVLYECLGGRRPYEGRLLVEVMAQMIDGPPPPLDDKLGDFVQQLLRREPSARPSLDEIAHRLVRPDTLPAVVVPRKRRRWPLIASAVAAIAIAAAVVAWQVPRREPAHVVRPPVVAAAVTSITVAPLAIHVPSYGSEPPSGDVVANELANLLAQVEGVRLKGVAITDRDLGARYALSGKLDEVGSQLHGAFELADARTGAHVASIAVDKPSPQIAQLLDDVATDVGRAIAPDAR
ncbi:MAG TPA: serine/threonine-protein kinase, partial [Kofleriaceae bacterium]